MKKTKIEFDRVWHKLNGYTSQYYSEKELMYIIKTAGNLIQYVDKANETLQLLAVIENGTSIQYIKNPSENIQLLAVKNHRHAIRYIADPCKLVIDIVRDYNDDEVQLIIKLWDEENEKENNGKVF